MSRAFLTNIDLTKNQLLNASIQHLATAPSSPVTGQVYFDTTKNALRQYNGTVWKTYTTSGDIVNGDIAVGAAIDITKLDTDVLARANHTGTQPASTISDFDTQVRTNRLDQMSAPTSDVSFNDVRITDVADPVNPQDAATKAYVDAARSGLDVKASVRVASTQNVDISGGTFAGTIDGVIPVTGDRVLLKDQTNGAQNGIYTYDSSSTSFVRASDADSDLKVTSGMFTFVEEGNQGGNNGYVLTTDNPITLNTTELEFVQFSGAGQITAGDGLVKDGNTINVVGTTDRIKVSPDSIDIDAAYVGQSSITTLGTITTGEWQGTTLAVAHGGTGATTAVDARANLGATTKHAESNPLLTSVGGEVTWTVVHTLDTEDVTVQVRDVASGALVEVDVVISSSTQVVLSWLTSSTVTAGAYRVVIVG
jgi:hypothetical protein